MGEVFTVRELRKMLTDDGWRQVAQAGSHCHFRHPIKDGKVTIPLHNKDVKKGTANSILKQAGLK
ncbi:toxin HicA [Planctomycetales bacterium]|nr:toxin HicA [Planctomycetales bacterium]GHT07148.1 toxin HicA [Planctomycetales bacterium]